MQIKLGQIVELVEAKVLTKLDGSTPPWSYRVACARFSEALLAEYNRYAALHVKLVRQYGVEDKDRKTISVNHSDNTADRMTAFYDGLQALLATEVSLTIEPLSLAKLDGRVDFTVGELRLLGALIVD